MLQANPEEGYRNALQFLKVNQDLPQEYIDMMVPKILLIEEDTASDEEKEIIKQSKQQTHVSIQSFWQLYTLEKADQKGKSIMVRRYTISLI